MELTREDIASLRDKRIAVLEEIFALTYTTSMTFADCWNMPISKRKWFIRRLIEQKNSENETMSGSIPKPPSHIPQGLKNG